MAKLLIADDDRVVLFTLAEGLREAGFEVVEARDGLRALALCQSEQPDLALLDIRMPGLDGLELARRLRAETTVPFLFFTAYDDEELVQQAVKLGALGYLVKPLDVPRIVPMLRAALARSREFDGLRAALHSNRSIGTAVGIAMRAWNLDQQTAFERLRKHARNRSIKLESIAREVVESGNCPE
ncbi:MAG: response regulator [Gammaproteobacteria bacterium]|nr:response regulator [Gammaproteobacteria bacterium]